MNLVQLLVAVAAAYGWQDLVYTQWPRVGAWAGRNRLFATLAITLPIYAVCYASLEPVL